MDLVSLLQALQSIQLPSLTQFLSFTVPGLHSSSAVAYPPAALKNLMSLTLLLFQPRILLPLFQLPLLLFKPRILQHHKPSILKIVSAALILVIREDTSV